MNKSFFTTLIFILTSLFISAQDFIKLGESISENNTENLNSYGENISLSSDGLTVAVGHPQYSSTKSGIVRIYKYNGTSWFQIGQDIEGLLAGDRNGKSVSLSGDGLTVAVGSTQYGKNNGRGYVRIYKFNGASWTQLGQDIIGKSVGDLFGISVSISNDGLKLAVGAPGNGGLTVNAGHVRIYSYNGSTWKQIGEDINGETIGDYSGKVSLSSDGLTVAIGSEYNNGGGTNAGHLRVYNYNGTSWMKIGQDIDGEQPNDYSGSSFSLSGDGLKIAITSRGNNPGHIKTFSYNGTSWIQMGQQINGWREFNYSGISLSLDDNGEFLAIGAKATNKFKGQVRVYRYNGIKWDQIGKSLNGDEYGNKFGQSVSFSNDGSYLAIGELGKVNVFYNNISKVIINYVQIKINEWQEKGEFEKTVDYQNRVNESSREQMVEKFQSDIIDQLKIKYSESINFSKLEINEYDADNETFLLFSEDLGELVVPVEIKKAPFFKQYFSESRFKNPDFVISNGKFVLTYLEIIDVNGFKHYYNNKSPEEYSQNNIIYNFPDIEIRDFNEEYSINKVTTKAKSISIGKPDVDTEIPELSKKSFNTYALIIGNEDYQSRQTSLTAEQNVDFALNDALVFSQYCEKTLGIPQKQIKVLKNATYAEMQQGLSWLENLAKIENGNAKLIFYYSGHGLPDDINKEPYLIPTDVSGQNVELALKLEDVYKKLSSYPSKQVTVFLDACFSGGARNESLVAMKGMKIKPQEESPLKNMVVFSSSSGEQTSAVYREKQHGYFTYFLLKKLQESKGEVSLGELSDYISSSVKKETGLNGIIQTPQIKVEKDIENSWRDMKLFD